MYVTMYVCVYVCRYMVWTLGVKGTAITTPNMIIAIVGFGMIMILCTTVVSGTSSDFPQQGGKT
jgi:hypothetical protein